MPEKIVNDTLRGIGLMTLAMAAFAGADSAIKLVSASLPAGQILAALGAGGALLFAAFLRGRGRRLITPYWIHPGVLGRNIAEIIGTIGIVSALGLIPLSQVSAIMQGGVLVVTLGAALFLGERVGPRRWAVVFIGLAGVLIIVAPAPGAPFTAGTLMAVVGMVGLSLRDLCRHPQPPGRRPGQPPLAGFEIRQRGRNPVPGAGTCPGGPPDGNRPHAVRRHRNAGGGGRRRRPFEALTFGPPQPRPGFPCRLVPKRPVPPPGQAPVWMHAESG